MKILDKIKIETLYWLVEYPKALWFYYVNNYQKFKKDMKEKYGK